MCLPLLPGCAAFQRAALSATAATGERESTRAGQARPGSPCWGHIHPPAGSAGGRGGSRQPAHSAAPAARGAGGRGRWVPRHECEPTGSALGSPAAPSTASSCEATTPRAHPPPHTPLPPLPTPPTHPPHTSESESVRRWRLKKEVEELSRRSCWTGKIRRLPPQK